MHHEGHEARPSQSALAGSRDAGSVGLYKVLPDAGVHVLHKRNKYNQLSLGKIRNNAGLSKRSINVEYYFSRMKNYAILLGPHKDGAGYLDQIICAATCLADMWKIQQTRMTNGGVMTPIRTAILGCTVELYDCALPNKF
ncbi:hypothetical protein CENSYa_0121 [Cenarchaeum symbiosum A]|uniref:Uncharacterized protein n=1 Tax=Cenarchaeum symbiosum (strain A) TaxID=414004 RepID=A0RTU9_CENSY|nr:hypothetical protein CENSYa_0121 [Cenarchaeum symbiosum A]